MSTAEASVNGPDEIIREGWATQALLGRVKVGRVIAAVCRSFDGVSRERLLSYDRRDDVTDARIVAMYLARKLSGRSYPALAREFLRDHTTVMSAIRAVAGRLE